MPETEKKSFIQKMKDLMVPAREYLSSPVTSQETVLQSLVEIYSQTEYGKEHHVEKVGSYDDYKKAFPVKTYSEFKPFINEVMNGHTHALLYEEPVAWCTTRGTTKGEPKLIPLTPCDVTSIKIGARVIISYAISKKKLNLLTGYYLNLGNRSNIGTIRVGDREVPYGYGIAVKATLLKSIKLPIPITPTQKEIDDLGGGSTRKEWQARHEFVYKKARNKKVRIVSTNADNALYFGRYLKKSHNIYPKDLWDIQVVFLGCMPGINTRFAKPLHELYGQDMDIRENYSATEGFFGAQLDEKKAWSPYYDNLFFEVITINGIKPMHEMVPGEIGSLVVSTPVFPRYRIGDLILAFQPPYFRCIGRENSVLPPFTYGKL